MKARILLIVSIVAPFLALHAQKSSDKVLKKMPQEEGMLYFLHPGKFQGINNKEGLVVDFTYLFRSGNAVADSVTMNFSLASRSKMESPTRLSIREGNAELFSTAAFELFYLRKEGKKWVGRHSATIPAATFFSMLRQGDKSEVHILTNVGELIFKPSGKWKKMATLAGTILAAETGRF